MNAGKKQLGKDEIVKKGLPGLPQSEPDGKASFKSGKFYMKMKEHTANDEEEEEQKERVCFGLCEK